MCSYPLLKTFFRPRPQQLSKLNSPIHLPNKVILSPVDSSRNLGVIFDKNLSFAQYISAISKSCFHDICGLILWPFVLLLIINQTSVCTIVTSVLSFTLKLAIETLFYSIAEVMRQDRVWNKVIRSNLKIRRDNVEKVEIRRLSYFGHVARMNQNRLPYTAMHGRVNGCRRRGRSKKVDRLGEGLQNERIDSCRGWTSSAR